METHERQEILATLGNGRKALLDALKGVPEDLAARIPAAGKWSILECVEHLAIAEDYLFSTIEEATSADAPARNDKREAAIMARGLDRTTPVESPQEGRPTGRFSTLAEALQHFVASRDRTIEFVKHYHLDPRSQMTQHPIIGTVNCYEVLLMMVVHPHRHSQQIREIRAALR